MKSKQKVLLARLSFFLVLAALGTGGFFLFQSFSPNNTAEGRGSSTSTAEGLTIGKRYRIFVKSIIVPHLDEDGDHWDSGTKGQAPDIFYRITYMENRIYESSTIDDVVVAEFSPVKAGITSVVFEKNASDYLEAANVSYLNELSEFHIEVIDEDTFNNDEIGEVKIHLKDLKLGNNKIEHQGLTYSISIIDADADINQALKDMQLIQ